MVPISKSAENTTIRRGVCGSVNGFSVATFLTSSSKSFCEPWMRWGLARRTFGDKRSMFVKGSAKSGVIGIEKCKNPGGSEINCVHLKSSKNASWSIEWSRRKVRACGGGGGAGDMFKSEKTGIS